MTNEFTQSQTARRWQSSGYNLRFISTLEYMFLPLEMTTGGWMGGSSDSPWMNQSPYSSPDIVGGILMRKQCLLVINKSLFMLLFQSPASCRGTHMISWYDQKSKEVPSFFPVPIFPSDSGQGQRWWMWGSKWAGHAFPEGASLLQTNGPQLSLAMLSKLSNCTPH